MDFDVPEPGDACQIAVTGTDKRWHVRYAGRDGQMATADDVTAVGVVHVPVDARVTLLLGSTDYVYTLALPQFGLKEIAVPSLEFRLHFQPDAVGEFELRGDQLCGEPHPDLLGRLFVEPREQFAAWLYAQSPRQAAE